MYLTNVGQRERLFEITHRWFEGRLEPGDARAVTEVFVFEPLVAGARARVFLGGLLGEVFDEPTSWRRLRLKDELRRAIARACPAETLRVRELFASFASRPEEFFPGMPVDMLLATLPSGLPAGLVRFKRIKRLAEKASRRVADFLADEIRASARERAEERARQAGVPLAQLVSSPQAMADDFEAAEREISEAIRDGRVRFPRHALRVDDGLGFKIIGNEAELSRAEAAISARPGARIVEREVHRGDYNDVNLIVELDLPEPGVIIDAFAGYEWERHRERGLGGEELRRAFPGYVEEMERSVRAELILTTVPELIESEFGRAIHEARILEQRRRASYTGRIATNASYIVEYLLMVAVSPSLELEELPVFMWGRYLPDTFARAVWRLFALEPSNSLGGQAPAEAFESPS